MDDDDAFLYGDSEATEAAPQPSADLNAGSTAAVANQADSGEDMDEADTDESDVEIILDADPAAPAPQPNRQGPHRTWGGGAPQINVAQLQQQIQDQQSQLQQEATFPLLPPSNAQALRTLPPNQATGPSPSYPDPSNPPDLSTPALVDDQTSLLDVDLDALESKPWTLPGAHVADYFNYGFDEASWRLYVAQQKQTREEASKLKENPFAGFAQVSVQEAWSALPPELKGVMMQTIMASFGGGMAMPGMGMPGMMPGMDMSNMSMDMSNVGGEGYDEEGYSGFDQSGQFGEFDQGYAGGFRGKRGGKKGANPFGLGAGGSVTKSAPVPTGPRAVSPLPANIPTGPRKAGGPPPEGPRASRGKANQYYRDKDASGSAQNGDGLDYGDQPEESSRSSKRSGRRSRGSRRKDYSDESEDEFQRVRRRSRSYSDRSKSRSRSRSPEHSKRRADDDSSKSSRSKRSRKTYD